MTGVLKFVALLCWSYGHGERWESEVEGLPDPKEDQEDAGGYG